jgi:hypothetical protein
VVILSVRNTIAVGGWGQVCCFLVGEAWSEVVLFSEGVSELLIPYTRLVSRLLLFSDVGVSVAFAFPYLHEHPSIRKRLKLRLGKNLTFHKPLNFAELRSYFWCSRCSTAIEWLL